MVVITDGLGRPLYVIDKGNRLHPYTYEKVYDNFVYEYPNTNLSIGLWPFIIIGIGSILVAIFKLF